MSKFRYYIVSLSLNTIVGTNDKSVADAYVLSSDDFVLDVQENTWLIDVNEVMGIPEAQRLEEDDPEDDADLEDDDDLDSLEYDNL